MNASPLPGPRCRELFATFVRLGATAFGGPAIIAHIRDLCVRRARWLDQDDFDQGVALAQVLPGPVTMHCAAFVGLRTRGLAGAAAAYVGLGLPAFLFMLAGSAAYAHAGSGQTAERVLLGLRLAIVAVVASAGVDLARAQVRSWRALLVAGVAAGLLLVHAQPLLVIAAAVLAAMLVVRPGGTEACSPRPPVDARKVAAHVGGVVVGTLAAGTVLVLVAPPLARLALTMMKIDALAFGGGYTAVPLMLDEFVKSRGALSTVAFMDGVALGQVTPGPIIVAATFIGYHMGGWLAATVATVAIFLPSFVFVIALAPWFSRLQRYPQVRAATQGATLAFIGLLAAVTVQFAQSLQWTPGQAAVAGAAFVALRLRVRVLVIVALSGLVTLAATWSS